MTKTGTCPSCGCIQPESLLCVDDTAALTTMLAAVPQLIEQMNVAIGKQARLSTGGKGGKGSVHERSPINWGVLEARDALVMELGLWGDDVAAIRRDVHAGRAVSGIGRAIKAAYRAIDRAKDRQYLGQCEYTEDGLVCHAELWVKPGAHQARCSQCDTVHDVMDRRAKLMERARDFICTPAEASRYLGEIGDIPVGQQRIRNYLDRKLIPNRALPDGTMRLRLGDLMDKLAEDADRASRRTARRVDAA